MGFVEGANVILVSTHGGFFSIELQSKRVRKMCKDRCRAYPLVPVVSSYTSGSTLRVPQVEHDGLCSPHFHKEGDDEEWEWEVVRQAELLFYEGSAAIKEGDFVAAVDCLSLVLAIRLGFCSHTEGMRRIVRKSIQLVQSCYGFVIVYMCPYVLWFER